MKSRKEWEAWNTSRRSKAKAKLATAQGQLTNIEAQIADSDYYYGRYSKRSEENSKAKSLPEEIPTNEDEVKIKTSNGWD